MKLTLSTVSALSLILASLYAACPAGTTALFNGPPALAPGNLGVRLTATITTPSGSEISALPAGAQQVCSNDLVGIISTDNTLLDALTGLMFTEMIGDPAVKVALASKMHLFNRPANKLALTDLHANNLLLGVAAERFTDFSWIHDTFWINPVNLTNLEAHQNALAPVATASEIYKKFTAPHQVRTILAAREADIIASPTLLNIFAEGSHLFQPASINTTYTTNHVNIDNVLTTDHQFAVISWIPDVYFRDTAKLRLFLEQQERVRVPPNAVFGKLSVAQKDICKLMNHEEYILGNAFAWKVFAPYLPQYDAKKVSGIFSTDTNVEAVLRLTHQLTTYSWIPTKFINTKARATEIYDSFLRNGGTSDQFLTKVTVDQYKKFMDFPDFHTLIRLTPNCLNAFTGVSKMKDFLGNTSKDFYKSLYVTNQGQASPALNEEVIKALPKNLLRDLAYLPNPSDAQYYTKAQWNNARNLPEKFNIEAGKKYGIQQLKDKKSLLTAYKTTSKDTQEDFSNDQWTKILSTTENCEAVLAEKFNGLDKIAFSPVCLASIKNAQTASIVVTKHKSLKDNISTKFTKSFVADLTHSSSSATGIAVLEKIASKNKIAIIKNLGSKVDNDDDHPCYELDLSDLKDLKLVRAHMSKKCAELIKFDDLSTEEILENADILAKREDAYEVITGTDDSGEMKAWKKMEKKDLEKIVGDESTVCKNMEVEAFNAIPSSNKTVISGGCVVNLPFVKDLTKTDYESLSETAFSKVSKDDAAKIDFEKMTDAQIPQVSTNVTDMSSSAFSAVKPETVSKMSDERRALFTSRQWAVMQPAVYKASFKTGTSMEAIPADSTTRWTTPQLNEISQEAKKAITAEQVAVMGSDIADAQLTALSFLIANKSSLSAEAQAALAVRVPGSSATSVAAGSAFVAALAALALIA